MNICKIFSLFAASLWLTQAALADESSPPKIGALPFKTAHVSYRVSQAGLSRLKTESTADLYIDTAKNRLSYVSQTVTSGKTFTEKKILREGNWFKLGFLSKKYLKEPVRIDPLIELFQAHHCAPYPVLKKNILGRETTGCEINDTTAYYWNNILMEQTTSGLMKSSSVAASFETDIVLDESVFEVPPQLVADKKEAQPDLLGMVSELLLPRNSRRLSALAAVDKQYAALFPRPAEQLTEAEWSTVAEKAEVLDQEWLKSLGWKKELNQSSFEFLMTENEKASEKSAYHEKIAEKLRYEPSRKEEELAELSKAIEKNPYGSRNFVQRARLYADLSKYPEALSDIDRSIRLGTHWIGDHSLENRAAIYCKMSRCEEAIRDLSLAINGEENTKKQADDQLKKLAEVAGEKTQADMIQFREEGLGRQYEVRGNVNFECKHKEDALRDFEKAWQLFQAGGKSDDKTPAVLKHQHDDVLLKIAFLKGEAGKAEEGISLLDTLLAQKDDANYRRKEVYRVRFALHRQLKQREAMLEDLRLADEN